MPDAVTLKYDAILIDADDTLFDFHQAEYYALERTLANQGLAVQVDSIINVFREINAVVWREYETGQSTPEVIRTKRFVQLLQRLGLSTDRRIDPQSVSDCYIEHLSEAAFLLDGAPELLERLLGTVPLVMLTNGLSSVQRPRFAKADVGRYFRDIVISEEVGVQKPDPEVFRIALERASGDGAVRPDRAIMIGDNLHSDIRGALDAGLHACWFNLRGRSNDHGVQPTYTVTSLGEIPPILGL
ncbi:MAG: YjjG family noncanonical pyrimidine nucleotidase [Spirochaetales bacterium]|nr:YjjG family noncanonical pyrimidine nucleotidase [Spirochaetales bacterium]